ncbi:hypothetical protein MYX75_12125 [Acidobacteria bacterium AH-259-A15]|nr:hypothetical protein [Acidobacteria bacterium AH-259-A15]
MIRTLILVSAMFTTFFAILVGFHSLFFDEGSVLWIASKVAVCGAVLSVGILTWLQRRPAVVHHTVEPMLLCGAMAMMVLGAAGVPWTFHLAHVTGDLEAWVIVVDLVMIGQGALTTWHLWNRANRRAGGAEAQAL